MPRWRWTPGCECCSTPEPRFSTTTVFALDGTILRELDHGAGVLHVAAQGAHLLTVAQAFDTSIPTLRRYALDDYANTLSWRREGSNRYWEERSALFSDGGIAVPGGFFNLETDPLVVLDNEGNEVWSIDFNCPVGLIDASDRLITEADAVFGCDIWQQDGTLIRTLGPDDGIEPNVENSGARLGICAVDESNGNIYVVVNGGVFAFDASYSLLWAHKEIIFGHRFYEAQVRSDGDLIVSWDGGALNRLYRLSAADGSIVWEKEILFTSFCLDSDDNIWLGGTSQNGVKEWQQLTSTGTWTGGTYRLGFRDQWTSAIPYNVNTAEIARRLSQLSTVQEHGIVRPRTEFSTLPGTVEVEFAWFEDVPLLQVDTSEIVGTDPGLTVTETRAGVELINLRQFDPECETVLQKLKRAGFDESTGEVAGTVAGLAFTGDRIIAGGQRVGLRIE